MNQRKLTAVLLSAALLTASSFANARNGKDFDIAASLSSKPDFSEKARFERTEREVRATGDRLKADAVRESMRDKSHDFPRVRVRENVSVGADAKGVNVRKTY
jgi:hypothetical protein